jgi:hypothetical protein
VLGRSQLGGERRTQYLLKGKCLRPRDRGTKKTRSNYK